MNGKKGKGPFLYLKGGEFERAAVDISVWISVRGKRRGNGRRAIRHFGSKGGEKCFSEGPYDMRRLHEETSWDGNTGKDSKSDITITMGSYVILRWRRGRQSRIGGAVQYKHKNQQQMQHEGKKASNAKQGLSKGGRKQ